MISSVMSKQMTTKEFAERVEMSRGRVIQLIWDGTISAEKLGRDWVIDEKYIDIVLSRPENRGRRKKSDTVRRAA